MRLTGPLARLSALLTLLLALAGGFLFSAPGVNAGAGRLPAPTPKATWPAVIEYGAELIYGPLPDGRAARARAAAGDVVINEV
ncbi:MAG: hypothetical protein ABI847_18485, partial [Anaerolineales bacterium]